MAEVVANVEKGLQGLLSRKSRVLLVNPPVEEKRYHWLEWNQPTDLLRLSAWLKNAMSGVDVRLFDFMLPDASGAVPRRKVRETWTGAQGDLQLWHFGRPYEDITKWLADLNTRAQWAPDIIIITSLTSYWHVSVEKLLDALCTYLGKKRRSKTKICIYGNYPRFEPEHAAGQIAADISFTRTPNTKDICPDFELYQRDGGTLPEFFALDIDSADVGDHLERCARLHESARRERGTSRPVAAKMAFFNDDVCGPTSRLDLVAEFAQRNPKRIVVDGIVGVVPRSLTLDRLKQLRAASFRTLFVEHARTFGGGLDTGAYEQLLEYVRHEQRERRRGSGETVWATRESVTAFVAMGLPDDDIDQLVHSTLVLNSYFQSVILKPYGYSPTVENLPADARRRRWATPAESSAQRFPYVTHGSSLSTLDYANLVRWQNVLNKRVKSATFDFLDDGTIARLVRETLVAESWKRHHEAP